MYNLRFIDNYFENASPFSWETVGDTALKVSLLPDYERNTLNRQTDHWCFRLEAERGTEIKLILSKLMPDVYNGRLATDWWDAENGISCYISYDQKKWEALKASGLKNNELYLNFIMEDDHVWLARLPVYIEKDLGAMINRISHHPLVDIIPVGFTVENRGLELIRMGKEDAKHNILVRARAHPWEPGGNWVLEGLIDAFLTASSESKNWQDEICYYIMPMANKDGVFHGMTRFTTSGMDLNRNWLNEADSILAPENYALDQFIKELIRKGQKPVLAIDFHNDNEGDLHLTKPGEGDDTYLTNMELFHSLLTEYTWFSGKLKYKTQMTGTGVMADGMYYRYGIDAFIFELNANYIEKIQKMPTSSDWMNLGRKLNEVICLYLNEYQNR